MSCSAAVESSFYNAYASTATQLFSAYQASATQAAASSCPAPAILQATLAISQISLPTMASSGNKIKEGGWVGTVFVLGTIFYMFI